MFRIFSLENVTKSNELLPLKGMLRLRRMRYENKCPIWNKTPDLNSIYIPQSTLSKWGPDLGRVILYTYQLIIPPPRLMTSSFAIVLHICKKALVGYSRMNWGCYYMTDMSSIMLLSASLHKSWTMFSHQFLRWVPDAISNAGRLTEEQRQRQRMSTPKLQYPWNHWQFNLKVKVPS